MVIPAISALVSNETVRPLIRFTAPINVKISKANSPQAIVIGYNTIPLISLCRRVTDFKDKVHSGKLGPQTTMPPKQGFVSHPDPSFINLFKSLKYPRLAQDPHLCGRSPPEKGKSPPVSQRGRLIIEGGRAD